MGEYIYTMEDKQKRMDICDYLNYFRLLSTDYF